MNTKLVSLFFFLAATASTSLVLATESDELVAAAGRGNADRIEPLLSGGVDPNAADRDGRTALMSAAQKGHLEVVEILLSGGANAKVTDNTGWTALIYASKNGHVGVVEILLKSGADVNASTKIGLTALRVAQDNQHDEIAEILLNSGANADAASAYVRSKPAKRSKVVRPIIPSLEQMSKVPSFTLGQGYQTVKGSISRLEMAIENPRVVLMLNVDGKMVKITKKNAPGILEAFKERLQVYRQAIEKRGNAEIGGWYTVQVNEALEGEEYFDMVELFADEELSHHEYVLAREIQIKQEDINVELARTMVFGGEERDMSFPGLAIGDSIVFEVPNIGIRFYGVLRGDTIEFKLDLNELERTLSFEYAVDSLTDPAKAAASGLNKEKISEWIVRLTRNPSNKQTEPSPSDRLLIFTPDKKLRRVTRTEISLD